MREDLQYRIPRWSLKCPSETDGTWTLARIEPLVVRFAHPGGHSLQFSRPQAAVHGPAWAGSERNEMKGAGNPPPARSSSKGVPILIVPDSPDKSSDSDVHASRSSKLRRASGRSSRQLKKPLKIRKLPGWDFLDPPASSPREASRAGDRSPLGEKGDRPRPAESSIAPLPGDQPTVPELEPSIDIVYDSQDSTERSREPDDAVTSSGAGLAAFPSLFMEKKARSFAGGEDFDAKAAAAGFETAVSKDEVLVTPTETVTGSGKPLRELSARLQKAGGSYGEAVDEIDDSPGYVGAGYPKRVFAENATARRSNELGEAGSLKLKNSRLRLLKRPSPSGEDDETRQKIDAEARAGHPKTVSAGNPIEHVKNELAEVGTFKRRTSRLRLAKRPKSSGENNDMREKRPADFAAEYPKTELSDAKTAVSASPRVLTGNVTSMPVSSACGRNDRFCSIADGSGADNEAEHPGCGHESKIGKVCEDRVRNDRPCARSMNSVTDEEVVGLESKHSNDVRVSGGSCKGAPPAVSPPGRMCRLESITAKNKPRGHHVLSDHTQQVRRSAFSTASGIPLSVSSNARTNARAILGGNKEFDDSISARPVAAKTDNQPQRIWTDASEIVLGNLNSNAAPFRSNGRSPSSVAMRRFEAEEENVNENYVAAGTPLGNKHLGKEVVGPERTPDTPLDNKHLGKEVVGPERTPGTPLGNKHLGKEVVGPERTPGTPLGNKHLGKEVVGPERTPGTPLSNKHLGKEVVGPERTPGTPLGNKHLGKEVVGPERTPGTPLGSNHLGKEVVGPERTPCNSVRASGGNDGEAPPAISPPGRMLGLNSSTSRNEARGHHILSDHTPQVRRIAFSTASGIPMSASSNARTNALAILGGDNELEDSPSARPVAAERDNQTKRGWTDGGTTAFGDRNSNDAPFHTVGTRSSSTVIIRKVEPQKKGRTIGKDDKENYNTAALPPGSNHPRQATKKSKLSSDAVRTVQTPLQDLERMPFPRSRGGTHCRSFQTLRGRNVTSSFQVMEQAKRLLENCERIVGARGPGAPVCNSENTEGTGELPVFQTGSGRTVTISREALKSAKDMLETCSGPAHLTPTVTERVPCPPPVFQTASGRGVAVSSDSLARAKALFAPADEDAGAANTVPIEIDVITPSRSSDLSTGYPHYLRKGLTGESAGKSVFVSNHSPHSNGRKAGVMGSSMVAGTGHSPGVRAFKPPRSARTQAIPRLSPTGNSPAGRQAARCSENQTNLTKLRATQVAPRLSPRENCPAGQQGARCPENRTDLTKLGTKYRIQFIEGGVRRAVQSCEVRTLMLEHGADPQCASEEWVANHLKWIDWRVAYLRQGRHKLLTLDSILRELQRRLDKEMGGCPFVVRGITEGSVLPSRPMTLYISSIVHHRDEKISHEHVGRISVQNRRLHDIANEADKSEQVPRNAEVEVTDGWYSMKAVLDAPLTTLLERGRLKTGQKITVCGAVLSRSADGGSNLEAFKDMHLLLHMNGTRKARRNQRVGYYKGPLIPLGFNCINPDGGAVLQTYVGVTRVYPVLFKETSARGPSVTRTARAEDLASRVFECKRSDLMEETLLKLENSVNPSTPGKEDEEEGLFAAIEASPEPDILMADMTPKQLKAFGVYQAKKEATRHASAQDVLKMALQEAGLESRTVKRLTKVRVVGLKSQNGLKSRDLPIKEGLITIWDAGDEQCLREGCVYCVSDLRPVSLGSGRNQDQIQLNSFSSSNWRHVPRSSYEKRFLFQYTPRFPIRLSDLREKFLLRDFDGVAMVVQVGEPFSLRDRANQWLFMTDGSTSKNSPQDTWDETLLLAVRVSVLWESFVPVDESLVGKLVGYCNLVQKPKDTVCRLWVAEASELAVISSDLEKPGFQHLQAAVASVSKFRDQSSWVVDDLRDYIRTITTHGVNVPNIP